MVDDEENMRYMLTQILKKGGHRVDAAHNGEEALNGAAKKTCLTWSFAMCGCPPWTVLNFSKRREAKSWMYHHYDVCL